jgi:hypothetical protein
MSSIIRPIILIETPNMEIIPEPAWAIRYREERFQEIRWQELLKKEIVPSEEKIMTNR